MLRRLPSRDVNELLTMLLHAYDADATIYLFGNGGSAALAQHFACDLGKGTQVEGRKRVRAVSLVDNIPLVTAWANDTAYENIFSEQLLNLIKPGDIAFAISGSGNSPNVLKGLRVAREAGAVTIGLGGFEGGKMLRLCDLCVVVPADFMQLIEDVHLAISHAIAIAFCAHVGSRQASKTGLAKATSTAE